MKYIISFDIAALFIYILLISLHYRRKNLRIAQNRAYVFFIVFAFFAAFFDVFTIELDTRVNNFPAWIHWVSNALSFFFYNYLPPIFTFYCCTILNYYSESNIKQKRKLIRMLIVPAVLLITLILINWPVYKLTGYTVLYSINSSLHYSRGGFFFYLLYAFVIYYFSLPFILAAVAKLKVPKAKYTTMLVYMFLTLSALAIQLFFPRFLVQSFGIALSSIVFATTIQTPEEFLDRNTNLFNREAFHRMTTLYEVEREKFLVISVMLDDTLFITNTFGIAQMNGFLQSVAAYLKTTFPTAEIYYLPQGKFALVFRNYNPRKIEKHIFELRARFHEPWYNDTLELKLYSRICVIEVPKDVKTADGVNDIIDMVFDDVRFKRTIIYAKDIDTEYTKHTAYLAHLLRNALAEKRFEVYYQPIYAIAEKKLIGAEALIRMRDENGDFVSPEEFIPIAERTGDILRIGQFVFDSVCKFLSSINIEAYGIKKIDINLSVAQCMQEILAEQILTIRTIHNIPSSIINMEITETASAHTPDILLKNMERLAEEGIELSLDDYGSGYSNMSYLLNLPFKMIKIDKYIVWSAFEDPKARIALSATIDMIKKLGMTVLAEGVETEEQKKVLEELGCDYLQGFYFAKGLPKDEFLKMMADQNPVADDLI